MNKTFTNQDVVAIVSFFNSLDAEKNKCLPTKMRWNIKKNIDKMIPIAQRFEKFKEELITDMRAEWFNEERSEENVTTVLDADGKPVLDADGNEQTQTGRKIKEEYIDEFNNALKEINSKLSDILSETVEIDISTIDVDGFVDDMDDSCPLTFEDLNILAAFQDE